MSIVPCERGKRLRGPRLFDRAEHSSASRVEWENTASHTQRTERMAWILLLVAGILEVGWAIGLKYTEGLTRLWPSVFTLAAMTGSVILLGIAMKSLPVGTSYAVWVGVGAVGTAILGIILFGESANAGRLASLGLIVAGIIGLKLATPG